MKFPGENAHVPRRELTGFLQILSSGGGSFSLVRPMNYSLESNFTPYDERDLSGEWYGRRYRGGEWWPLAKYKFSAYSSLILEAKDYATGRDLH